ncbi:universal stress protein [Natribaculum luteum]|uniref:Universal stress protein n=1 Tax=Natribaculum luteum TaxID=1586232 RepID=A0ABD5NUD4_9EURY|nr:universal stress protein [Natribaculum luteum]
MYRVLLPIDTSEDRALAQADYVASLPCAGDEVSAYLLFVFTGDEGEELPEELGQFKSATRVGSIRRAREVLDDRGVEVHVLDDSGEAAADICDRADDLEVDEIVLGGRKRSAVGKAVFGSVTQSVIRNTDRPVVVTGERRAGTD